MKLFTELMKNEQIKRSVLIEFGLGNVSRSEIVKWVKDTFPTEFSEITKNMDLENIMEFFPKESERIPTEEIDGILKAIDDQNGKKVVCIREDHLDYLKEAKSISELEREALREVIHDFIEENDLGSKFYDLLKEKIKGNYQSYCDFDYLIIGYIKESRKHWEKIMQKIELDEF